MSDHVTIQYCISYRNKTSKGGKDGGGFDLDGGVTNSLIQYCLSYENEGAGYGLFQYPGASGWANNVIRYCVSINDAHTTEGAGSFFIWNGSDESKQLTNCYIHNNLAYSTSAPIISYENASEHESFLFCNNIFIGTGKMITGKNTLGSFTENIWTTILNLFLRSAITDITDRINLIPLQADASADQNKIPVFNPLMDSTSIDRFFKSGPQGPALNPIHELN
jgi:hypothetical protein